MYYLLSIFAGIVLIIGLAVVYNSYLRSNGFERRHAQRMYDKYDRYYGNYDDPNNLIAHNYKKARNQYLKIFTRLNKPK